MIAASGPVLSDDGSDNYRAAMAALEKCETAWFEKGRLSALDELARLLPRVVLEMNPMSRDFEEQSRRANDVTEALRACTAIVYPE